MTRKTFAEVPFDPHTGHMQTYPSAVSEWRPSQEKAA
ncbi:hypothetical protein NFA_40250 [Nocardia farcinica IFM 10152]|uniref:Uncharacterized protein n=1 Tax=Nocardia farcinica (strain IFM 10152) TaxID=247156 RepID=Q5YSG8_NOCFA|nr:hypothetical protein NFA_40250 [Nocardia farcinica IFM 10152]